MFVYIGYLDKDMINIKFNTNGEQRKKKVHTIMLLL